MSPERTLRWSLVAVAILGLAAGIVAHILDQSRLAHLAWTLATIPVVLVLAVSIVRDLLSGRFGVDAIALLSMAAALLLGESLAGAVVALMYAGGNVLEDLAVFRAEQDLRLLVDRAPRVAHRHVDGSIEDVPVAAVAVGDGLLVRAGEVIPVDGVVDADSATIDESALTGEPIPVARQRGSSIFSGTLNAGDTFQMTASSIAGESAYAGIVRLVTAAQTAKAPFIRLADRYALVFLPITVAMAGFAWWISGDLIRSLAVLVAATPCPLILAAPVAFIAGVAQAARRGILIKGGGPLEMMARVHTILFDKTGTLTVGGARLISVEVAPGAQAEEVLSLGASLEQASHHVLARAIVQAARERGLTLLMPREVNEAMGTGLNGLVGDRRVAAGSRDMIWAHREAPPWALRAARRASWRSALVVFVTVDEQPVGALLLADELRPETPRAIRMLRAAGAARIVMLTGDHAAAAEIIGAGLDLDTVLADRAPADKVDAVRTERQINPTIMVGDGINDAPALAAADVGIAMGAAGASASSEAAPVVILANRLDRVGEAIVIAQRARGIAVQSIAVGMGLSILAMLAATAGLLAPVPAAILQEVIDVTVIVNALRALKPARRRRLTLPATLTAVLHHDHVALRRGLDRLKAIADAMDDAALESTPALVMEANAIVQGQVVEHERDDEGNVYPKLSKYLADSPGLSAMSRAHREILHLARLLARIVEDRSADKVDQYWVREAQRVIESIEALVSVHTAQEEDLYEAVTETKADDLREYRSL
jgi:heavy metal translocating P-type ATPase